MKNISTHHIAAMVLAGAAMTLSVSASADPGERAAPRGNVEATINPAPTPTAKPAMRYCIKDTLTGSHIANKVCKTRSEWMNQGFDPLAGK